jgi:group I intron endonuclease
MPTSGWKFNIWISFKWSNKLIGVIYKITNKITNKIYIGQTTRNINKRFEEHTTNNKYASYLTTSINKYGKDNFTIDIICYCFSKEELNKQEIFFIFKYKTYDKTKGYNISLGGQGGNLGEVVNQKISKSKKKYFEVESNRLLNKLTQKIVKNTKEQKLLHKEITLNYLNKNPEKRENLKTLNKEYFSVDYNREKQGKLVSDRWKDENWVEQLKKTKLTISVFSKDTLELIGKWKLASECCKDLNLSRSKVSNCLNKKRKSHKGYIFSYG